MSIAGAFKKALPRLWDGKRDRRNGQYEYICHAIPFQHKHRDAARRVVMDRLYPHSDMQNWIEHRGYDCTPQQIQAHRRAWLEQLIKEFS